MNIRKAMIVMGMALALVGCGGVQKTEKTVDSTNTEPSIVNANEAEQDKAKEEAEPENNDVDEKTDNDIQPGENSENDFLNIAEKADIPILRDTFAEKTGGHIGCSATLAEMQDPKVFDIITTYFERLTFGNELKPDALFGYSNGKCPGLVEDELDGESIMVPKMDFSRAETMLDMIYDWNEANPDRKVMIRGHVLVWHSQTPEWFFHEDYDKSKDYVTADVMDKRMEWYIKTVLTHFTGEESKYKDMFYGWDVVNEAISDNSGTYRTEAENAEPLSKDTHGSNSSWWKVYQSNKYIINAFKFANKYAPSELELYYNDYNETNIKKKKGILELLTAVKEAEGAPGEGTRISGMGMQGHYDMSTPSFGQVGSAMKDYAEVVGNVQLTELDMKASDGYDGAEESKAAEYESQRKRYNMILFDVTSVINEPGVDFEGITFWGTVDQYSWLQTANGVGGGNKTALKCCPLLFDENYEPKPCYFVFAGN